MRKIIIAALLAMAVGHVCAQQHQNPQGVLNELIERQRQQDVLRKRNEDMRLELERLDLERQLQYRRLSNEALMAELLRYCPTGEPPCSQPPPDLLLQEAAHRRLITLPPPAKRPGIDCVILGDDLGGGIAACD